MLRATATAFVVLGLVAAAVWAVVAHSWVSDDAMITLRYASNLVHGYGPVFNAGERVQGFTHPLWLLIVAPAVAIDSSPIDVSVALGALFTAATIALVSLAILRRSPSLLAGAALSAGLVAILVSSEAWLSFQTGGLENSLTHFLLALLLIEATRPQGLRVLPATLVSALLFLSRPDFAVLVLPLVLLVALKAVRERKLAAFVAGSLPALAWEVFALAYYGSPLPNTLTDKVGIYPSLGASSAQGLAYARDWVSHEPISAIIAASLLVLGLIIRPDRYRLAIGAGLALYLGAVVAAGGDFMRGRFLLPLFFGGSCLGMLVIAGSVREGRRYAALVPALVSAVLASCGTAWLIAPAVTADVSARGIVNERAFYSGYQLAAYRRNGALRHPTLDLADADILRAYTEKCGPLTLHSPTPGALAYLSGPSVSFVDTIGLTDRFIARLPRSTLVDAHPRPGHPIRTIPVSYLASRHDVAILEGWWEAVVSADCSFSTKTDRYVASSLEFQPLTELPP